MIKHRTRAAFIAVVLSAVFPLSAHGTTLSLEGASTKVCQLTGDVDWASNLPTAAQTLTNFGLDAVDLGFPVDSDPGPLFLLFGDTWPTKHPPGSFPSVPPDDSLGVTTRTSVPDPGSCLDVQIVTAAPQTFAYPTVLPPIQQGSFNVPTGGIFVDGKIFAFFWTNHCVAPTVLAPDPGAPLTVPAPNPPYCLEIPVSSSIGHSVLAWANLADLVLFHRTGCRQPAILALPCASPMPSGFVYVSAARVPLEKITNSILAQRPGILVFGVPRYRASVPYLAIAPSATFANPATWWFYAGLSGGNPVWITRAQWESGHNASGAWVPPPGAEIYAPLLPGEQCVGEHSVTWNVPLHAWLLLYNCGAWSIQARTAPDPWGPWSKPTVLLGIPQDPGSVCTIIMGVGGCPHVTRRNYWPVKSDGSYVPGFFYAPFVMNRYTRDAIPAPGQARAATIYWLVSTWNPYDVIVMQSTLAIGP